MKKEKIFKEWLDKAESKFNIVGDLSYFNCIRFEISEEESYVIGLDEEGEEFMIMQEDEQQAWFLEASTSEKDLDRWLNIINSNEPLKMGSESSFFPKKYRLQ